MMNSTAAAAAAAACRPPFTAAQWQELEHQALIFKYLMAGMPVPPELLIPIRRSFDAMAARFYNHPAMGYCSYYGKKLDPEPGRCRRTDGKKWRCAKEAYGDSKYCERHMHRGRNRSRKPVETHTPSQSQPQSAVTSLGASATGGGRDTGSFHGTPLSLLAGASTNPQGSYGAGSSQSQLHFDPGHYGMGAKDYRYLHGAKTEVDEHSFFSEASGSARGLGMDSSGLGMDSSMESSWRLMASTMPSFSLSTIENVPAVQSSYPQLQSLQDFGQAPISSLSNQQQQYSLFGSEYGSAEAAKHETQSLRPFFDEWPKTRGSWSDVESDRSNRTSFSTTQLSISIPRASSDFSTTSSRSPNDD